MKPYKKAPRKPLFSNEKQGQIFLSLIKDEIYRKVAKCIFVDGMTNEETAFEIGYCVRQIERIRQDVLKTTLKMLVELNTPKKPINIRRFLNGKTGNCPVCNGRIIGIKHCQKCGQALDWGN